MVPGFFGLFELIFPLMFLLVFGMVIFVMISNLRQWNKNNHSPRLTVDATVVTKRTSVSHHHHDGAGGVGHTTHSTSYYATFQVERRPDGAEPLRAGVRPPGRGGPGEAYLSGHPVPGV